MSDWERVRELALKRPRAVLTDDVGELRLDRGVFGTLERAGIDRVSVLRAIVEEHGTAGAVSGVGPARAEEIRKALDLYDTENLDPADPDLRAAACTIALTEAGLRLAATVALTDDRDEQARLAAVARAVLPTTDHGFDEVRAREAGEVFNGAFRGVVGERR